MIFEKMLVGYAPLDKPDALLLGELSNQNMEIGNLLVRSRKTLIAKGPVLSWAMAMSTGRTVISPARWTFLPPSALTLTIFSANVSESSLRIVWDKLVARRDENCRY